jgi:hypothetical protein
MYIIKNTIYIGFFPKGPGAIVDNVPVEKDWAYIYCCNQKPSIKLIEYIELLLNQ